MKRKVFVFFLFLLLLCSCIKNDKNEEEGKNVLKVAIAKKVDKDKEYVYFEEYRNLKLSNGSDYILKNAFVNLNTDDAKNINLELKNFVAKSYKNLGFEDNKVIYGNIIYYDCYVTSKYISLLQNYSYYISKNIGVVESNVYVIEIKTGKLVNNEGLMNRYNLTEEELILKVREEIESDDIEYTIMNMKENYSLYVNEDSKLVLVFIETSNDEAIKRELILE